MKQSDDEQHLHLLSIFHYVVAGLTALVSCIPIIHFTVGMGLFITSLTNPQESGVFPGALFGLMFALIGGSIVLLGWAFAVCTALAGRFLSQRKHYTFCLVIAAIQCAFTPFGTVLGVFTIIVLVRPSVKALFMPTAPEIPQAA